MIKAQIAIEELKQTKRVLQALLATFPTKGTPVFDLMALARTKDLVQMLIDIGEKEEVKDATDMDPKK